MLLGERIRILARFLFSSFNVVSCPPAQRAHAQAGARGGYKKWYQSQKKWYLSHFAGEIKSTVLKVIGTNGKKDHTLYEAITF